MSALEEPSDIKIAEEMPSEQISERKLDSSSNKRANKKPKNFAINSKTNKEIVA
jgi:hypothetical protein